MPVRFAFLLPLVFLCFSSKAALAFGTIRGAGQDAEHGRITRRALACQSGQTECFEAKTLDSLAGSPGDFGAVGAPDRGRNILTSYAHCSAGDYFAVSGYPQSPAEAQAKLKECRDYMLENLNHTVLDAAALLDRNGRIRGSELPGLIACTYIGSEHGRAPVPGLHSIFFSKYVVYFFYAFSGVG